MSIRGLVIALMLMALLGLAWQQQERLRAWLAAAPTPTLAGSGGPSGGSLRKCVKGQQVTYTNEACPAGHKEQAVAAGSVTVLPATPVGKPSEASSGPSALHKALDITRDDTLRDKAIQRAVSSESR